MEKRIEDFVKLIMAFHPLYVSWSNGISLLSAICREAGIETELAMLTDVVKFASRMTTYEGRYVAFSAVCSEDYKRSIPYMRIAKEAGKTVLLGGVWTGLDMPVDSSVDFVCRGEGQQLPEFLLKGDEDLFKYKLLDDFDHLPMPDYEMFKDIPFERGFSIFQGKKVLPYVSSRGCIHQCSFCQIRYQPAGMRIRRRMAEELTYLRDTYHPDIFFLGDAMLPYHDKKWRKSWGDFRHPFVCYIRADIKYERLEWLIDRGMVGCAFGVESGDESFRNDVLKKGLTDEQLFRTVSILKAKNIEYVPFFMSDIPSETFIMKTKTAKMVKQIGGSAIVWQYDNLKEN